MNLPAVLQAAAMFIIPLAAVMIPVLMGERYGMYRRRQQADFHQVSIDSVVSAAFGLLAFMLGFTFQIAANRFDSRKALLFEEVKDIRTAYLRAGLIPEPYSSDTKKQLVEYVDIRVALTKDLSKLDNALSRSQSILDSLWKHTESLARQDRSSEVYSLYTTSINDMIDAFNERIALALIYRIPGAVIYVLFIIVFLTMLMLGYQFGVAGQGSFRLNLLLGIIFSVVMFLIFALDRPETGLVNVNQKPLLMLQQELQLKYRSLSQP